jgi:hypothetical protein
VVYRQSFSYKSDSTHSLSLCLSRTHTYTHALAYKHIERVDFGTGGSFCSRFLRLDDDPFGYPLHGNESDNRTFVLTQRMNPPHPTLSPPSPPPPPTQLYNCRYPRALTRRLSLVFVCRSPEITKPESQTVLCIVDSIATSRFQFVFGSTLQVLYMICRKKVRGKITHEK